MGFKILVIRKDYLIPEYFFASDKSYYYSKDITEGTCYPTYEAARLVLNYIATRYADKDYFLYAQIVTDDGEIYDPNAEQKKYPIKKID